MRHFRSASFATACIAAMLGAGSAAAEPVELAAQGRLTSVGGGPVADGTYGMAINFYDVATGGNPIYQELLIAVPVSGGVFSVALGAAGSKLDSGVFTTGKPIWIGVVVGSEAELPRVALRRVPYAVQANTAAVAADLQCSGCVGADDLAKGAVNGDKIANGAVGANHVSFSWAAGDSAGGAATFALGANTAKLADVAKQANVASFADEAASAKAADVATSAKGLLCTGCVGTAHLGKSVTDAFVSSAGGTVTGKLSVTGGIDLSGSALAGANFAAQDPQKDACGAGQFGRIAPAASGALWFCNGKVWLKIKLCAGTCLAADKVACGQPIADDCGDAGACSGSGSYCAGGGACQGGMCASTLGQASNPAASCKAILAAAPATKDGTYWLDPDGGGGNSAFQALCDMTTDGGGWTLVGYAGAIKGNKTATVGAKFFPLFDDFGKYDPAAPANKVAFSRVDLFLPNFVATAQLMARRTSNPNRILIWPVADSKSWRVTRQLPPVTVLRMSKDGKTFFDRKNNLTVFQPKPMPEHTGYNWNTPADENCDGCGRGFDSALNHRSLLYWEASDSDYAATQWFHASPLTLEDSTGPSNSAQDIEFWLR